MTNARNRKLERIALEQRKSRITNYLIQGLNQRQMAGLEKCDESTISRALKSLKNEARQRQAEFIENQLPMIHTTAMERVSQLIAEIYEIKQNSDDKPQLIRLLIELTQLQMALAGDPQQITLALKTVAKIKRQIRTPS